MPETRLLVLGLGNVLCTDDGVGPTAVARLWREWEPPPEVSVVDGGTLGMTLMPLLEAVDEAILVDAVTLDDEPPGTRVRLEGEDIPPAVLHRLSPHQIGVADLLDSLRLLGRMPPRLILLGLVPESITLGIEPTPAVKAAIPALVQDVVSEALTLGHVFRRRAACETDDPSPLGLLHALGL